MGMTIDTAIKNGIDLIDVVKEYWPSDKAIDTVGELVEIAKKYQKIEQIVKEWSESGLLQDKFYDLINEVLEYGNDD